MVRDITANILAQSKDFGRKPYENYTRIDLYRNKIRNIFSLLGEGELSVKVINHDQMEYACLSTRKKAEQIVSEYGSRYFLDIFYTQDQETILLKIRGMVPNQKKEESPEEEGEEVIKSA